MGRGVHLGMGLLDATVAPDDVADPLGPLRRRTLAGAVGDTDLFVRVAQERVGEVVLVSEGGVFRHAVRADPQDLRVALFVLADSVTESLALDGSPRRVGHGVEPENHNLAGVVAQPGRVAGVGGNGEVGGALTYLEHNSSPSVRGRILEKVTRGPGTEAECASCLPSLIRSRGAGSVTDIR